MSARDRVTETEMFDPVDVTISTNVDQQRHLMTDEDWINLGKYVADAAERTRAERASARASTLPPTHEF